MWPAETYRSIPVSGSRRPKKSVRNLRVAAKRRRWRSIRCDELRDRSSPRRSGGARPRAPSTRAAPPGLPCRRRPRRETRRGRARAGRRRSSRRRRAASGCSPPRARRPATSGSERGRISRWIAAASSSSRSIALLLDGVLVQARRLDRRGRLVGEEREQARVRRREVEHAADPRFLVGDGEDAEPPARHRDRDGEALLAARQPLPRRRERAAPRC